VSDGDGALLQVCGLGGRDLIRLGIRRHDVSEAIGCGGRRQVVLR
jgi:hypothetical protein